MRWVSQAIGVYILCILIGLSVWQLTALPPSAAVSQFSGIVIAHRGDSLSYPENSLMAIENAAKLGADAVEIDVMMTSDGVLVALHDDTVDRTSDGHGAVEEHTLAELQKLKLKNLESNKVVEAFVPTLEEVVQLVLKHKLKLEIELKTEIKKKYEASIDVAKLFKKYDLYQSSFVSSFDPRFLYYLRSHDPNIVTALSLTMHPPYNKLVEFVIRRDFTVDYLGVGILEPEMAIADTEFLAKWQSRGKVINVWTVNSERQKKFYNGHNVSITTDCPGSYC